MKLKDFKKIRDDYYKKNVIVTTYDGKEYVGKYDSEFREVPIIFIGNEEVNIKDIKSIDYFKDKQVYKYVLVSYDDDYAGRTYSYKTTLSDIDTSKLHYVKVPENHIVIDFDLKDADGNKSFELNAEAAAKWPLTYAELSKSGAGIHLHYIYNGDVSQLSRVYDANIEVKIFTGDSSLRRKLTKCNNIPIATISSGLQMKEKDSKKVINFNTFKNDQQLRNSVITRIKKNLNKEYHANTKPSIDFIYKILEDAYASGRSYDVSFLRPDVMRFAEGSTNNQDYCVNLVRRMKFKSDDMEENKEEYATDTLIFYDVEVFPNLDRKSVV